MPGSTFIAVTARNALVAEPLLSVVGSIGLGVFET